MKSVERIDTRALTPQTFASRYCSGEGQPVVLTGAFKGLPTCSPEWLVDLLPDAPFPARLYGKDHFRQAKSTWTTYAGHPPTDAIYLCADACGSLRT